MWGTIFSIAHYALLWITPFAGFAILDILNCIRENKPFWLPSKIIIVLFVWLLGWTVVGIAAYT